MLLPKLFTTLRSYDRRQLGADLTAGVIVGIVALPLAIAFAIASGVPPERGLYTAIVAGFLISALGGSRVQIGGPTGAFVVIVYGIVQQHGYTGLAIATLMAGVMLIGLGVARLGGAIKFIPYPVTIGFTSGIALIIFSSQISDLLGMRLTNLPAGFAEKWRMLGENLHAIDPATAGIAAATLLIMAFWNRLGTRIPGPFVALLAVTGGVMLGHLDVETIGTRFGVIHAALPAPHLPFDSISWPMIRTLVQPAIAIALLGAIESLLSAVVADGMIGARHRSNMELVAQGVANIASPLFGGIPATGAIARTATNVKNGGRTPVAGITHAITLLLITLFFGRWVGRVPMAVLASILVVVAWHMSEWRTFVAEIRGAPRSDVVVMLATFGLTVLIDLVVAIEVGMVLAAFLFMKRMAEVTNVSAVSGELTDGGDSYDADGNAVSRRAIPTGVQIYEINGPFFFGAAETFRETVGVIGAQPKVLILRLRHVHAIDSTAMHALKDLHRSFSSRGTLLLLSDVHAQPLIALGRSHLLDAIGDDHVFGNIDDALDHAARHLGVIPATRPAGATPTVARESGERPALPG